MKFLKVLCLLFLLIYAVHFFAKEQLVSLRVNITKYTQKNLPKNTGAHKLALTLIHKSAQLLPLHSYAPINRTTNTVGVGHYQPQARATKPDWHYVYVSNTEEITKALRKSLPGTIITVAAGEYFFSGRYLRIKVAGKHQQPIILTADKLGEVIFNMDMVEGLVINSSNIQIENIIFKGVKKKRDTIEHAIHLVGNADNVTISHNEFINFNAHIKANGLPSNSGAIDFPDNVVISHNNFYNQWKRNTLSPASPIDVVGGNNWHIHHNFIADFGKYGKHGAGTTYGLFLKGASKNAIIEKNLIACEWQLPHTSANDVRIALSLGNGGTATKFCMDQQCKYEHSGGIIRHNQLVNCPNDVAIYLNKATHSQIYHNYIANSLGIDVRFKASSAEIFNNALEGRINARDGASINTYNNISLQNYWAGE